jgi:hypothetical protein
MRLRENNQVTEVGDTLRSKYPQLPGFFDGVGI